MLLRALKRADGPVTGPELFIPGTKKPCFIWPFSFGGKKKNLKR